MISLAIRRRDDKVPSDSGKFSGGFGQQQQPRGSTAPYKYNADDFEEIKEDSLTRLKQNHSGSKQIPIPKDCEFESFPEITARTADKLKAKGIVNLFPIQ